MTSELFERSRGGIAGRTARVPLLALADTHNLRGLWMWAGRAISVVGRAGRPAFRILILILWHGGWNRLGKLRWIELDLECERSNS